MDLGDSYFDMLQESRTPSPIKEVTPLLPPPLMGFNTFTKNTKPEVIEPEEEMVELKPAITNELPLKSKKAG